MQLTRYIQSFMVLVILLCANGQVLAADVAPKLDIGKGGKCVEDPKFMRSNHMKLIVHQRDDTLRLGIRGSKYELSNCVNCHASKKNHSVLGTSENFCQGCHEFAAVKIDCFECHSSKPETLTGKLMSSQLVGQQLVERSHE